MVSIHLNFDLTGFLEFLGNGEYAAEPIPTANSSAVPAAAATVHPAAIPKSAHSSVWKYPAGCVTAPATTSHGDSHVGSEFATSYAARYAAKSDDESWTNNSTAACVITKRIRSNIDGKHPNCDFYGRIYECRYVEFNNWSVDFASNASTATSKSVNCNDNTLGITDVCCGSSEGESRRG